MNNFGPSIGALKPLKMPKVANVVPAYKPIKIKAPPAPKIAEVHVAKVNGGFTVHHQMTHGPKVTPFVFSDPAKMTSHLKRIQASAWRMPGSNESTKINKALDLNGGQGSSSW